MQDPQQPPRDSAMTPSAAGEPPGVLWLVYLYLRPRIFFRHFVIVSIPALTGVCAWLYGIAGAIDHINQRPYLIAELSWPSMWLMILVMGLIAGLLYFRIGGWWFITRLKWSGACNPDPALARRVYIFAATVFSLPMVMLTVLDSGDHESPTAWLQSEGNYRDLLILVFLFWSIWTSFRGVRTAFVVSRGRAVLWFLALPVVAYGITLVGMGLLVFLAPADLANPLQFNEGRTIRFSYPGNWWVDTADPNYDPDASLSVEPIQDALVNILVYEAEGTPEDELAGSRDYYASVMSAMRPTGSLSTLGRARGSGSMFTGTIEGEEYELVLFVSPLIDGWMLEVHELCRLSERQVVKPGFNLIRSSLRVHPPN